MAVFLPSRAAQTARRRLLAVTALVIVLFVIDIISGGKVRMMVRAAATRIWSAGEGVVSSVTHSGFFATRAGLERENEALRAQLEGAQMHAAEYQVLKDENESLRGIVHLAGIEKGMTAPIVSSVWGSPYGTFLIGAGSADGVEAGDLVLGDEAQSGGIAIGRVHDVDAHTSLVVELLAPHESIEGVLAGASVTIEGKGGGNGYAKLPRGTAAREGDVVRAPLLGNHAIGIVGNVHSDPASAYQDVYIGLPVGLNSLTYIYVIPQH